ncbi:hypothetical protein [Bacillus massiliigorillae]|uniref:hypothetical protein n=1 Tax=Bacillus massiliigorillae TaxID=1243664 RepID=UPI0003A1B943|nr:hypothetical protein [Bacillus massiliigorillae]
MSKIFHSLIGETVQVEVSGKKIINGTVRDIGSDIIVLFDGIDYIYMPIVHMKNVQVGDKNENNINMSTDEPGINVDKELSFRKVLTTAKGMFVEIYIASNQSIHGYVTSIMNNYFVFYSPIFKTMYVTLNHVKWLIPYPINQRPYGLDNQNLPVQPTSLSLARTFEMQVERLTNEVVVFDMGETKNMIGKINKVADNIVELQIARDYPVYLNLHHIKSVRKV